MSEVSTKLIQDRRKVRLSVTGLAEMWENNVPWRAARRFQPTHIELWFEGEHLWEVQVTGPAIRANGSVGVATRYRGFMDHIAGTRIHTLRDDTPDWVRRVVKEYDR